MRKMISLTIMVAIIVLIVGQYNMLYMHERAHQQIFARYGIDSEIEMTFEGGTTTPGHVPPSITKEKIDEMNALHLTNDITGYQMQALFSGFTIAGFAMVIVLMIFLNRKEDDKKW